MDIPNRLRTLFSATIEKRGDSYVVEIPDREVQLGDLREGGTYRVAVFPSPGEDDSKQADTTSDQERTEPEPPVEEGERRTVEIKDIGEQGDGIARVERGFVVIVPDAEEGERVEVEVTDVNQNVAFAEITERLGYYS